MKYTDLFILTCLSCLLYYGCGNNEIQTEAPIRPVRYAEVALSGGVTGHTFSGTAQSGQIAKLSFRVNGTLRNVPVKVGDRVKKGQLIANMDAVDYSIQYDQALSDMKSAETQVKSAQTQLTSAKSNYERVERLYENNSLPLSEYEGALANYEASVSQLDAARATYLGAQKRADAAKNQVAYTRLLAPFSGVITSMEVEANEMVPSGNPVAILEGEGKPEVHIGIPEIFISRVQQGQGVEVSFSVLEGQTFTGKVSEVGFSAGGGSTYPVIVQLDKVDSQIRPGMAANVKFSFQSEKKEEKPALITPVKSVGEGPDGKFVFLLQPEGEAYVVKKQTISIGNLIGDAFEVNEGIKQGDLVATAGLKSLLDGMKVKLMEQ